MKKRIVSLLLVVMMLLAVLPVTALADAAANIVVKDAVYYSSGTLKSITTTFDWTSGSVTNARLILSSKYLSGSNTSNKGYGDFTNLGNYGSQFANYNEAAAYDNTNKTFGFIQASDTSNFNYGSNDNTMTLEISENAIPLNVDGTYYVYLWVTYNSHFYPDNLICVIQVKNGALQYTPGIGAPTYRNHYDASAFKFVESKNKYDVSVTPANNMIRDTASGAEMQEQLSAAMTPVVYTAASGYYFPETYSVATVNGINVKRISDSQIQVYGTPSASASITLAAPSVKTNDNTNTHTCLTSRWLWNDTNHWRRVCQDAACPNNNYQQQTANGAHVYTDDYDADCNSCGYTRTPPAKHPETGDITHLPLWTMMFVGGLALLWVQLTQRKREQF